MMQEAFYTQLFKIKGGDFSNAGTVSIQIKKILKEIGLSPDIIYRVSICSYEAEMNVIMYALKADVELTITPREINIIFRDEGKGIENIELAMKEGFSTATNEMREMGFGAGMGLSNINKNSDSFKIESLVKKGTTLFIKVFLN